MKALLEVSDLKTHFATPKGQALAVDGLNFEIGRGETYALVGESGCGKSVTALSIMGLLPTPAGRIAAGSMLFDGTDLARLSPAAMQDIRGRRISMIFQEPMTSLNPVLTIGHQIAESMIVHGTHASDSARDEAMRLLELVRIPDPRRIYSSYPHMLSGGMRQRAMIAMALACRPELLIADEPTTALDVTIQEQILALMADLKREFGTAVLLITHNLGVVKNIARRVGVMYAGRMAEEGDPKSIFSDPRHPYTVMLLESIPAEGKREAQLATIPGSVPAATDYPPGCRFAARCQSVMPRCKEQVPPEISLPDGRRIACFLYGTDTVKAPDTVRVAPARLSRPAAAGASLVSARGLRVHFPITRGVLKRTVGSVKAVDGLDLEIASGSVSALVGESGCGKSTAGKALLGILPIDGGSVEFEGRELGSLGPAEFRPMRRRMQMIFQDPYSSLNPRKTVQETVEEGPVVHGLARSASERRDLVARTLERVGLGSEAADRYPHEFSGGQRQRISIARALAVNPIFLVCDEATSALDVSVQAQILNLLMRLKAELGLTYLFITHDLGVVEYFSDRIEVMYLGRIVEAGSVGEVFGEPRHPYTRALIAAVPRLDPGSRRERIVLAGDVPSPAAPPSGCHFHPRCPQAMPRCALEYPGYSSFSPGHRCRCFLYSGGAG